MAQTVELPGVEGPGVAPVKIAAIEKLAEDYIKERDKRVKLTPREVAAKQKLIDAIHKYRDKLGTAADGTVTYRYDDTLIILKPGKETLKVQSADEEEPNE